MQNVAQLCDHCKDSRSPQRQRQVKHLYQSGPRVIMEALLAVANGEDLDDVLADFNRIPVNIYRAIGADQLPIDRRLM
jgi:hypothetical protein